MQSQKQHLHAPGHRLQGRWFISVDGNKGCAWSLVVWHIDEPGDGADEADAEDQVDMDTQR